MQSIRGSVPPRELAATITASAVLRAGWAVAAVYLSIAIVAVVDLWIDRAYPPFATIPLVALVVTSAALLAVVMRPGRLTGILFLAVGSAANFAYVYGLLTVDPTLGESGLYLVNRMSIVLLLIGAVSSKLVHGLLWCTAGWLLGLVTTMAAQAGLGLPLWHGYGPLVSLAIYLTVIVTFLLILKNQRRFAPDFSAIEVETARLAGQRELEERAVALLHDTVLNSLLSVANGRSTLDKRTRERYLRDIESVTNAGLEMRTVEPASGEDEGDTLRRELLTVINDFRWQGLTVDVTGGDALSARLVPSARDALVGAVRGCLENVLRHAGSERAELFLDVTASDLSVMISDHGVGFDPHAIPEDSLGIRRALVQRMQAQGGTVRIWSAPDAGTSVVMTLPLAAHDA